METDRRTIWVPGAAGTGPRLGSPIVVLTCGRSGSTLLRFLLDAHPALACPPETGLIDLSMRMSVLSRLLDGPQSGSLLQGEPRVRILRELFKPRQVLAAVAAAQAT